MSLKLGLVFALIRPYKILLLDEPTSALDAGSRKQLVRHLSEARTSGASALLTTHDPNMKSGLADQVYFMDGGHLHAA